MTIGACELRPEALEQIQDPRQGGAGRQRALGRTLDHRAVGQRIRERHADLEHVGPGAIERAQDPFGPREVGIAGGDVRHEARRLAVAQPARTSRRCAPACTMRFIAAPPPRSARPCRRDPKVDDDDRAVRQLAQQAIGVGNRVRRFERRQDPFEPRQRLEPFERLRVGDVAVLRAPEIAQPGVLRARPRHSRARPKSNASARCCPPRPAG